MGQKLVSFKGAGNLLSCHSLSVLGMGHGRVKRPADVPEEPSILEHSVAFSMLGPLSSQNPSKYTPQPQGASAFSFGSHAQLP